MSGSDGPVEPGSDEARRRVARAVAWFDAGEFWSAHEEFEPLWLETRSPLLKACILLAAACLHAGRDNHHGATVKAEAALRCLENATRRERGFDVTGLRSRVARLLADWRAGRWRARMRLTPFAPADLPTPTTGPAELPYRVRRYDEGYRPGRDPRRRD